MTERKDVLCERLKRLGFESEKQIRLYGEDFELIGDPIVMRDDLVFIDAIEKKSGQRRRLRIPVTVTNVAKGERHVA